MKRKWENHELATHWTIDEEEQPLINKKRGVNRLGFALLLKFFQLKGRFPEKKNEIPRVVRAFVESVKNRGKARKLVRSLPECEPFSP